MYAAIDIGGTHTRIGFSRDGRRFFAIEKFRTPKRMSEGMRVIAAHIQRTVLRNLESTRKRGQPLGWTPICIAVPGSVDARGGVHGLANLPDWNPKKLARAFARVVNGMFFPLNRNVPINPLVVNDADAVGIGEARRGAGRGYRRVAYFTLSTGVGGALITDGRLDQRIFEPGHERFVPNGRLCGCGRRGCFESYASGKGFLKTYGIHPEHCRNKKIWEAHAQIVGKGLMHTIVRWSPDIVVIGGGLAQAGALLFTPLRAYIRSHCKAFSPPPILRAKLGDHSGLYGCLELMRSNRSH